MRAHTHTHMHACTHKRPNTLSPQCPAAGLVSPFAARAHTSANARARTRTHTHTCMHTQETQHPLTSMSCSRTGEPICSASAHERKCARTRTHTCMYTCTHKRPNTLSPQCPAAGLVSPFAARAHTSANARAHAHAHTHTCMHTQETQNPLTSMSCSRTGEPICSAISIWRTMSDI